LLCFTVFSAVFGLELSLDNEQHKCRSIVSSACIYYFSIPMCACYALCEYVLTIELLIDMFSAFTISRYQCVLVIPSYIVLQLRY
jgi:hypothetical protein